MDLKLNVKKVNEIIDEINKTRQEKANHNCKFIYIDKLPSDIFYYWMSFFDIRHCYKMILISKSWQQIMNDPYCWPTTIANLEWLKQDAHFSLLVSKLYSLKVPVTRLEIELLSSLGSPCRLGSVRGCDFMYHMPLETFKTFQQQLSMHTMKILSQKPLIKLILSNCGFGNVKPDAELESLANCSKLKYLDLSFNNINGMSLKPLIGKCNLTSLILQCTSITDVCIPIICQFPLEHLNIKSTRVTDISLEQLKIRGIKTMVLDDCEFTYNGFERTWHELSKDNLETFIFRINGTFQRRVNSAQTSIHYNIFEYKNGGPPRYDSLAVARQVAHQYLGILTPETEHYLTRSMHNIWSEWENLSTNHQFAIDPMDPDELDPD